ncbi:hypothetical protein [Cupriavidus agavae]|uniref:Uncharacterized protein n=1 Tax=Cupriavidus agavae TaxID=1001822 RepID=A0A4Q7SAM4_9BURK|nr:hypothetical protein [Cupriavidus agavae]RZT42790.1 hypothetical protein EV147_1834 [Cupriavidus agavae]
MIAKLLLMISILLSAFESTATCPNDRFGQPTDSFLDCGVRATYSDSLSLGPEFWFRKCTGYSTTRGGYFSFAPVGTGSHDPGWLERIPHLTIKRVPLKEAAKSRPWVKRSTASYRVSEISGKNWKGWMVENVRMSKEYTTKYSHEPFVGEFKCIRLLIGNSKASASMDEYCLQDTEMYDIDGGINYPIFMGILNSVEFSED